DVGVVLAVVAIQRLDHRARLLRGGGVVEVGERLPVHDAGEHGEVGADAIHVERRGAVQVSCGVVLGHFRNSLMMSGSGRRPATAYCTRACTGGRPLRPMTSPANAKVSRLRATASGIARLRR